MGSAFSWMCSPVTAIQSVCYTVKVLDYICDFFDLVTNAVVESVKKSRSTRSTAFSHKK